VKPLYTPFLQRAIDKNAFFWYTEWAFYDMSAKRKARSSIKKVVIPAAGLGTRFLPATKAMPKEMLPIVDKPVIQYIVEEAVASGIEDVIIVTGQNKRAVEDHFDSSEDLVKWLEQCGKSELAEEMRRITCMANFVYIRQKGPYGNGTPVLNAKHIIGNEPFAVAFGDDLILGKPPHLQQLIEVFEKYGDPVLTAFDVDDEGTKRYGIIDGIEVEPSIFQVNTIQEKPGPEHAPSRLATIAGYILTPDIFEVLEQTKPGKNNELWLPDALVTLSTKRPLYAKRIAGTYYDIGSKLGWLRANIELGLLHNEHGSQLKEILKGLV
jgi:UTP--glucose-1-phosphate uridylyltransferase